MNSKRVTQIYNNMIEKLGLRPTIEHPPIGLLLLGTGESGKSTLYKQFSFTFKPSAKTYEQSFQDIIWSNIIQATHKLLVGSFELGLTYDDPEIALIAEQLKMLNQNYPTRYSEIEAIKDQIKKVWNDRTTRECYQRGSKLQLLTSTEYLLSNVDRIFSRDYKVTQEDVLRSYVKTTGLSETPFTFQKERFKVFDTGGQRSERVKWKRVYSQATVVIFVASLVEYDQILVEDSNTNRMEETLSLFESVCSKPCFTNTPIILLLNKADVFAKKLSRSPLQSLFPEYEGGTDEFQGIEFIKKEFLRRDARTGGQKTFPFVISAIDSNSTPQLLQSICKNISNIVRYGTGSISDYAIFSENIQ